MPASSGIAVIRIALGLEFMMWALEKTRAGWLTDGTALALFLGDQAPGAPGLYQAFLATLVLPNVALFAQLVTVGEWAAGISLALGLMTRVGAMVGMWLVLNFVCLRGLVGMDASIDRVFFVGCLTCLMTAPRSSWSLDNRVTALINGLSGRRHLHPIHRPLSPRVIQRVRPAS